MKYRTSPQRYSFWEQCDKRSLQEGRMNQETYDIMREYLRKGKDKDSIPTNDFPDLEYELRTSDYIHNKCTKSEDYCRDLYAALCNNEFTKGSKTCSYTWRIVGGIIANILEKGDYIDWYCSGHEGFITEEVKQDLKNLGWFVYESNT